MDSRINMLSVVYVAAVFTSALFLYGSAPQAMLIGSSASVVMAGVSVVGMFMYVRYHFFLVDYFVPDTPVSRFVQERILYPLIMIGAPIALVPAISFQRLAEMLQSPWAWLLFFLLADVRNRIKRGIEKWTLSVGDPTVTMKHHFSALSFLRYPPKSRRDLALGDIYFLLLALFCSYLVRRLA